MPAVFDRIDRERIARCETVIRPYIRRTPIIALDAEDLGLESNRLVLKLELYQQSGSFKTRGAFANLLLREVPETGVVAASGGNHGVAVAYAAMKRNVPAKIFVPSVASPSKLAQIRDCGADLVIEGNRYADALAAAEDWAARSSAMPIHAFDQHETVLGQGSLAKEFEEQAPEIDTLLVAVGGGGLIAGIAAWYAGRVKIVGVEPSGAPTLSKALEAGHPVDAEAGGIAADSLAPRRVGALGFPIVKEFVYGVVLVSDEAIVRAQKALWSTLRLVAEPGGAAAFAALLSGGYQPAQDERVGVVICGGNTTAVNFDL
jgi:threonine dehydratase